MPSRLVPRTWCAGTPSAAAASQRGRSLLTAVLAHEAKEPGRDYLLVDGPLASNLNAIGALFGLIFRAAGK